MKNPIILLPILLLLLGCSATTPDTAPQSFDASSEKGLAIGTITFEGDKPVNDIYRFFYESTSGDKKFKKRNAGKILIKAREGSTPAFNGDFNYKKSYLFVIEREPGQYAFNQYNYLNHIGPTGVVSSSSKFAIPFEIKKGNISYIGDFTYVDNAQPGTPRIIISDNNARDLPEFKKKFPAINWDAAQNNTVKSGNSGNGTIAFQ